MELLQALNETIQEGTGAPDPDQDTSTATAEFERSGDPELRSTFQVEFSVEKNLGEINLVEVVAKVLRRSNFEPKFLTEVGQTSAEPSETYESAFRALCSSQLIT